MRKVLPLAVVCVLLCAPPAFGSGGSSDSKKFRDAVSAKGMIAHEAALQAIGTLANGNRLAGTKGHDASSLYVRRPVRASGPEGLAQDVRLRPLPARRLEAAGARRPARQALHPGHRRARSPGGDFGSMVNSASGDVTAPVWAADLTLPSPAAEHVRLRLRGRRLRRHARRRDRADAARHLRRASRSCSTRRPRAPARSSTSTRATPASRPRRDPRWFDMTAPASTSRSWRRRSRPSQELAGGVPQGLVGKTARAAGRLADRHDADRERDRRDARRRPEQGRSWSARTSTASAPGPGINDNGSGSAALLEFAAADARRQAAQQDPLHLVQRRGVRAAGLGGLRREPAGDRAGEDRRDAELRHDRLAELRALRLRRRPVGLAADRRGDVRAGGAAVLGDDREDLPRLLQAQPDSRTAPTAFDGRSDYGPFIAAGIPAGGLFTGAEEIKTPAAGGDLRRHRRRAVRPVLPPRLRRLLQPVQPGLDQNADAAAHVLLTLAQAKTLPARDRTGAAAAARTRPKADTHDLAARDTGRQLGPLAGPGPLQQLPCRSLVERHGVAGGDHLPHHLVEPLLREPELAQAGRRATRRSRS